MYYDFFIENASLAFGFEYQPINIVLPLAISFFTFQQIAYIRDAFLNRIVPHNLIQYTLFVTFFPQLIAGPIVMQREILPQFFKKDFAAVRYDHISVGLTLFVFGLFKKIVFADQMAKYATSIFTSVAIGEKVHFFKAWCGALSYTLQLYFDFSGYSDMAVGLGLMFSIHLPINFYSPYKSNSIIEFWKRWHITLSRFLKDHLYIPLGGGRIGDLSRYRNLMIVMVLGGLWHGAGWTFIFWGGLHGIYLIINHGWRNIRKHYKPSGSTSNRHLHSLFFRTLTFLAVVFAWVLFRSESIDSAILMYQGMLGINGILLPVGLTHKIPDLFGNLLFSTEFWVYYSSAEGKVAWREISILLMIVWLTPNSIQILSKYIDKTKHYINFSDENLKIPHWEPRPVFAIGLAIIFMIAFTRLSSPSEFLYFQF